MYVPCAREMVIIPFSSGWRRISSTERGNSGNSSRNNMPRCASDTSPGFGIRPPPVRATADAVWCGDRNGRCVISCVCVFPEIE